MHKSDREKKIIEILQRTGGLQLPKMVKSLGISMSTIHRDLERLEKKGLLRRIRGGAVLLDNAEITAAYSYRIKIDADEKREIARKAVSIIQDNTSIFLDHSSTCTYLAREIGNSGFHNLNIITNSLVIPMELMGKSGIQILVTGGIGNPEFKAVCGKWVVDFIKSTNLHQVFISIGAISVENGLMTQRPFIYEMHSQLISLKREINVLAASSKFYKIQTFHIAPLSNMFKIITDSGMPSHLKIGIEKKGCQVII